MEITRKFWLVGAVSVFMVANFASATVINLDMSTAPTTHGFYITGTLAPIPTGDGTGTEDITTNTGQLTITTTNGSFEYRQNILDNRGSGDIISFGATITLDEVSTGGPGYFDREFVWSCDNGSVVWAARFAPGMSSGAQTYMRFGGAAEAAVATDGTDGLAHTYRLDVDKATGIGTFYFDGNVVFSGSVVSGAAAAYNYIGFGDFDASVSSHSDLWDDVFFSNEVLAPATGTVLVVQ